MHRFSALVLVIALVTALSLAHSQSQKLPLPATAATVTQFTADAYREAAGRIIGAALADDTAYRRLAYLSDHIGNRLSGSPQLDAAISWAMGEMKRDGLDNVHTEKVMVPHWVRGQERAELLEPTSRQLVMLGLGNSVGTPPEGITADVLVVNDFDELEALGERVRNHIVLYNAPFTTYDKTVVYRSSGASRAARYGAVAALVRSVTPVSLRTPHTGALRYADDQPKIPAAAITIEDAETLARMQARGERIRLRLTMGAKMLPDVESANVVAELRGREHPEEVVVIGGHLDSWDVGTGSTDDGGGCMVTWEVIRLLKRLNLRPRRTIRVVLFTNEENGVRGGLGYRDAHQAEIANHVLAIESDSGVTRPFGFGITSSASPSVRATVREIATLLRGIGADRIAEGEGGTDIGPLMRDGVPAMGLAVDTSHYFDIHHTPADTMDKIESSNVSLCVAVMGVMAYTVADMPARLGRD